MPSRLHVPALIADVLRHAVPLVQFYFFGGSLGHYTLLTAFDLALGLLVIVATTRESTDVTSVDPRSRWASLQIVSVVFIALFLAGVAAFVAVPIAMPAYIYGLSEGIDWGAIVTSAGFWQPAVVMSLIAAVRAQVLFVERTSVGTRGPANTTGPVLGDLADDRRRSLADNAAQVTMIATYIALSVALIKLGGRALDALPLLYGAALVFFDARPDIARRLFPELWQGR